MARREGTEGMAVLDRPFGAGVDDDSQNGAGTENDAQATTQTSGTKRAPKRSADERGDSEMISLNVRVPNALRKQIAETAVTQNTSVPQLIAQMLADAYTFELPKSTRAPRTKKYASKEDRIAAQKAQQQKNRQITRAILQAVEDGKLDVDIDALLAEMQAKQTEAEAATS